MAIDLNALRQVIRQNQSKQDANPSDPARQIVVDGNGNVKFGTQSQGEAVTVVPQETFAFRFSWRERTAI
jgi:hypothetical protein